MTCFGHLRGHLQGGKCKNTNILIECWDHSTFKILQFWLKFQLNGKNSDKFKILEFTNGYLEYGSVE